MASLQSVHVGRPPYDRIVASRRVNGTPRPMPVLPRGPADQRRHRLRANPQPPCPRRSDPHGRVAALKARADRLGLVARIDRHRPTSRRPLAMGTPLVRAARKRAVWPGSTRAWAAWAHQTSVHRLVDSRPAARTSPSGWAQLEAVSGLALAAIAAELPRTGVHDFQLPLDPLCDDTSHLCTDLASGHERAACAQRGHSQPTRFDRRPCRLARLVARDTHIPRDAAIDAGQTVEAPRVPASLTAIRQRVERVVGHGAELPLVDAQGHHATPHHAWGDQRPGPSVTSHVLPPQPARRAMSTTAYALWGTGP
jgi:hypothetical protein